MGFSSLSNRRTDTALRVQNEGDLSREEVLYYGRRWDGNREAKKCDLIGYLPWGGTPFPFPFVLRDLDRSSFGLVGSCCVYALGVLKQYNNGELEVREFVLV